MCRPCLAILKNTRYSEITQFKVSPGIYKNIGRFQIPVDHLSAFTDGKSCADIHSHTNNNSLLKGSYWIFLHKRCEIFHAYQNIITTCLRSFMNQIFFDAYNIPILFHLLHCGDFFQQTILLSLVKPSHIILEDVSHRFIVL